MHYRALGRTGLKVSEISFGIGNNDVSDDAEGIRMLQSAFDMGINMFDTSNSEKGGKVEEWMGKAFTGSRREQVILTTKFKGGATRKQIMALCDASLKRMGVDYIDIYQFFRWHSDVPVEESMDALTTLVQQGKILYAGCCTFKTYQVANTMRVSERHGYTKLVSFGAKYNLLGQDPFSAYPLAQVQDLDLIPYCEEEGIGLIPFRPLAGGLLTGKYTPASPPPPGTRFAGTKYSYPEFVEQARPLLEVVEKLRPLAERRGETLTQFP